MPIERETTCVVCSSHVEEEIFQGVHYDPDHPTIDIGPFCSSCVKDVRRCSGCYHVFHKDREQMAYFGEGVYYCHDCKDDVTSCDSCGRSVNNPKVIGGRNLCERCFRLKYSYCDCCGEYLPKEVFISDELLKRQYKDLFSKWVNVCSSCFRENKEDFKEYEVVSCKRCGDFFTKGDTNSADGYCPICIGSGCAVKCSDCDKYHHECPSVEVESRSEDGGILSSIKRVCSKCTIGYTRCGCGRLTKIPKVIKVILGNNTKVCGYCYKAGLSQCKVCLSLSNNSDDKGVCPTCKDVYTQNKCAKCGRINDLRKVCRVCDNTDIYNYSYRPPLHFLYTEDDVKQRDRLFFGIEREVSYGANSSTSRARLKQLYRECGPELICCKSDSSINGAGYEIVTQPMTFDYYQKKFPLSSLFNSDIIDSDSCGMHIHIDKKSFKSDVHLYRVVNFIHNFKTLVNTICGRDYNHFNAEIGTKVSKAVKEKGRVTGRHCRVNLTASTTVEFRMFANPTTEFEMNYRVEFLIALIRWSSSVSLRDVNPDSYTKYVKDNSKKYPALYKFLLG